MAHPLAAPRASGNLPILGGSVASDNSSTGSSPGEIAFLVCVLAPVTGACLAGPGVGLTLLSLSVIDSLLMLVGVAS